MSAAVPALSENTAGVAPSLDELERAAWPRERLGQALVAAAQHLGSAPFGTEIPDPSVDLGTGTGRELEVIGWVEAALPRLGLGSEPLDGRFVDLSWLWRPDGVLLLSLPGASGAVLRRTEIDRFVIVTGLDEKAGLVRMLGPEGERTHPLEVFERRLFAWPRAEATARIAGSLGLDEGKARRVRRVLARNQSEATDYPFGFALHRAPAGLSARMRAAGVVRDVVKLGGGAVAQLVLAVVAFWQLGRGALEGRLEAGWLAAFALTLATLVVSRMLAERAAADLSVKVGALLRERALEGVLRLEPEEIRGRGLGQLMGMSLEIDALEPLARGAGIAAVVGLLEIGLGAVVLVLGGQGLLPLGALGLWALAAGLWCLRFWRTLGAWWTARMALTDDLVEKMVGHRTVVAQERPERRHRGELATLSHYEAASGRLDRETAFGQNVLPRVWLVLGLLALGPAFALGTGNALALAAGVGGVLFAYMGFERLADAAPEVAQAFAALRRLRVLLDAAGRRATVVGDLLATAPDEAGGRGLIVARDLAFRYPSRPEPVLRGCNFELRRGDRVIVTGPSGGGKSTLGSILAGLRRPDSGVLLLGGFDPFALSPQRWRGRSAAVPQFHENHVISASLAFNLFMGRRWPAPPEDREEVQAICEDLGLDKVIARMPSGLEQLVGDNGWQLSHGECNRLYVARSLMQRLDVRVLDESFSALDPETLEKVIAAVDRRSETLVVIAHP